MGKNAKLAACALLSAALLANVSFGDGNRGDSAKGNEPRLVKIGELEWKRLKKEVDDTGIGVVEDYSVAIIVTNPVPPVVRTRARGGNAVRAREPVPYVGQGGGADWTGKERGNK